MMADLVYVVSNFCNKFSNSFFFQDTKPDFIHYIKKTDIVSKLRSTNTLVSSAITTLGDKSVFLAIRGINIISLEMKYGL